MHNLVSGFYEFHCCIFNVINNGGGHRRLFFNNACVVTAAIRYLRTDGIFFYFGERQSKLKHKFVFGFAFCLAADER
jgi:hypothetical protein